MPERWELELRKLRDVEVREPLVRQRVDSGPSEHRPPTRRDRVAAGVVAVIVFLAACAFAWRALAPSGDQIPFASRPWPVSTVTFTTSGAGEPLATLDVGGTEQEGLTGAATSPNDRYPYSWLPPDRLDDLSQPVEVPMGSELALDGDVAIKELLYGDAEELDDGAGPDSGPIWSDQPDFSEPYFLPWDEKPERTYLKFFGTWPDGQVLDVYFEVVFVEPTWDVSDATADIAVSPEPMEAALIYGGQRMPAALNGGQYGRMSITTELTGWDDDSIFAKVAAGTSITMSGDHLVDVSAHFGPLPFGAEAGSIVETFPEDPGRSILTLDVTWDDGAATFLLPIEVVPAPEGEPVPRNEPSTPPSSAGSVVIDIRRSSEETGDPEAIARLGDQEVWMCPDGWTLVNPDGTEESVVFDCGQSDVFAAPVGTPIDVTGDFATIDVSTRLGGEGSTGAPTDRVADLEPGTIVTFAYDVTWDDGSEASFWLLVTVAGGHAPIPGREASIVVRVHGLGERSDEMPIATYSFGGQTETACTESWEWMTGDGQTVGGEAFCSGGPEIVVPPGTLIAIEAATVTRVITTRTTTPFFDGDAGLIVSAEWPEGNATFRFTLTVSTDAPDLQHVVLDCRPEEQIEFADQSNVRLQPGASSYITANLPGFERDDVVEQMTRRMNGDSEWSGIWQVIRDGQVVASIDWDSLSGTACRGSGIGGT